MNTGYRSFTAALSRSAMAIVSIAIAVVAYFWFIQPRVSAYLLARNEVRTQQARLQYLQDALERGARIPAATDAAFVADFTRLMSADDKVSEILASIARSLGSGDADTRVRGLLIEAGERLRVAVQAPATDPRVDTEPRVATPSQGAAGRAIPGGDPRAQLLPGPLVCTPVTVSFESDFEAIGTFLWRLRDAPTVVEVSSLTVERGLPLMKVRAELLIYQRLGSGDQGQAGDSPRASAADGPPGEMASNQASR